MRTWTVKVNGVPVHTSTLRDCINWVKGMKRDRDWFVSVSSFPERSNTLEREN